MGVSKRKSIGCVIVQWILSGIFIGCMVKEFVDIYHSSESVVWDYLSQEERLTVTLPLIGKILTSTLLTIFFTVSVYKQNANLCIVWCVLDIAWLLYSGQKVYDVNADEIVLIFLKLYVFFKICGIGIILGLAVSFCKVNSIDSDTGKTTPSNKWMNRNMSEDQF